MHAHVYNKVNIYRFINSILNTTLNERPKSKKHSSSERKLTLSLSGVILLMLTNEQSQMSIALP